MNTSMAGFQWFSKYLASALEGLNFATGQGQGPTQGAWLASDSNNKTNNCVGLSLI